MSGIKLADLRVGMKVRCTEALNMAWHDGDMTITRVESDPERTCPTTGKSYVEAVHETRGTGGFYVGDGDMVAVGLTLPRLIPTIKAGTQLAKVRDITIEFGNHWTLRDLAHRIGGSEAAISARLRDLRALGYDVKCHKHKGEKLRTYTVKSPEVATA